MVKKSFIICSLGEIHEYDIYAGKDLTTTGERWWRENSYWERLAADINDNRTEVTR